MQLLSRKWSLATSGRRPSCSQRWLSLAATALLAVQAPPAAAQSSKWLPDSVGLHYALNEFRDTTGLTAAWQMPTADVWLLRSAHHVDLEFGLIHAPGDIAGTVLLAPAWRWPIRGDRYFIDFRFGPLLITNRMFGESDIGGHLHFSSKLSLGWRFGDERRHGLAFEVSHISNGDIDKPNPGLDMIGLTYSSFAD